MCTPLTGLAVQHREERRRVDRTRDCERGARPCSIVPLPGFLSTLRLLSLPSALAPAAISHPLPSVSPPSALPWSFFRERAWHVFY